MIQFEDCHLSYGANKVLNGLSFEALDGKVTGFVGPNGAGKSTAFKILLGLLKADAGSAHVDGKPYLEHRNPGEVLGTYLGPNHIPNQMTGASFLNFVAGTLGVPKDRNAEYLEAVGIAHAAKRKIKGYSLGMRQRLGVAAAFVGEPQNLVLDEPVNGLDIEGVRWMRDYLRAAADAGRCVLLSSHLLSELELVADNVVILGQGRATRSGTLAELQRGNGTGVMISTAHGPALSEYLGRLGFKVKLTGHGVEVVDAPLLNVAAAVGAQSIEVDSIALATRKLEDVYMDQVETDQLAITAGGHAK